MSLLYNTSSQNTNHYDTEIYKWIMKNNDDHVPNFKLLRTIQRYFSKELCIKTQREDYRTRKSIINWLDKYCENIFSYISVKSYVKIIGDKSITLQSINDQQIDSFITKIKNMHIKPQLKPQPKPTFESRICKKFTDTLNTQKFTNTLNFPIPQINFIKQMTQSKSLPNISHKNQDKIFEGSIL